MRAYRRPVRMGRHAVTHTVIRLTDVCVRYDRDDAIHDISASFAEGTLTAVAGPNGAGKSTLLKAIAGIIRPRRGRIDIDPCFTGSIAYLPQASTLRRDIPMTVLQTVCTGFWHALGETGTIGPARLDAARAALQTAGLDGFESRRIADLSGGQFQRVLFARLMVQDARIILLDEPFAAIDAATTARLMQVILDWHKQGRTIICVLHDLLLIRKYFPESFVLSGHCMGRGHTHDMFENRLLSYDLDMAELHTGMDNRDHLHRHDHN